jgi:DNA-directed RNA polymerase specialized sigma24 family protein
MMNDFATTQWSLVLTAANREIPEADYALQTLCRAYWYPLYAYIRRRGHQPDAAQDLTQAFFTRMLEGELLAVADHSRGRFRSFLLQSLKNFLSSERRRQTAQKRGAEAGVCFRSTFKPAKTAIVWNRPRR